MALTTIKKRDGSTVSFDRTKIRRAMELAATDVNPSADLRPFDTITDHAVRHLELHIASGGQADVESIQDFVERSLMEFGLFDIAKAYILYRAERTRLRESGEIAPKRKDLDLDLESSKAAYVDAHGKRHAITRKMLTTLFTQFAKGYESDVDVSLMVSQCEQNLYDGMSEGELARAMIMGARSFIERDPSYSKVAARAVRYHLSREAYGSAVDADGYREGFVTNLKQLVENGRVNREMLDFDLEALAKKLQPERDELFDFMGIQVLYDRYFLRVEGGEQRLETAQAFWMRVAMGLALPEKAEKRTEWATKFYDVLSTLRYTPSTPTLFHAGTTYPQLSSCYLNVVFDDLHHIFKVYSDNAQLSKYSGGIGTSWSKIRATGSLIKTTNLESQGVVPFLRIANDVNIAINRSGKRRGATCVYLETWHYEIEDFLDLRKNTGDERRRTHDLNTANWIPDLFMKRVTRDENWTLFSPDEVMDLTDLYGKAFEDRYQFYEKQAAEGRIRLYRTIKAKDLWRKMISMLFETGHPWITFKDPCNVRSPQDHVGVIHNSNLCTEITLNNSEDETAVCNIGSINLGNHVGKGSLDIEKLSQTVEVAVRMLDNTIDAGYYPTPETRNANLRHRPVGLGIMGYQDALYQLGITFDSDEGVRFSDTSMEVISYHAIRASALIAKEKGAYESFKGSKWDRGIFPVDTLDILESERGMPIAVDRSTSLDWTPVRKLVKDHGMRNSNVMAIAPTATISNINGSYPCIEPIYKNLYVKSNMSGEFTVVNEHLVADLKELGLWNETMLEELKRSDGSVQNLTTIPPKLREKYKTVFEVGMHWLIKAAAYRGKWIDQAQSVNIFFSGTSGKTLSDVYLQAWHLGLKTTYYLRSMAASGIEKSTISLTSATLATGPQPVVEAVAMVTTPTEVHLEAVQAAVPVSGASQNPTSSLADRLASSLPAGYAQDPKTGEIMKSCRIDDPDCEACQ